MLGLHIFKPWTPNEPILLPIPVCGAPRRQMPCLAKSVSSTTTSYGSVDHHQANPSPLPSSTLRTFFAAAAASASFAAAAASASFAAAAASASFAAAATFSACGRVAREGSRCYLDALVNSICDDTTPEIYVECASPRGPWWHHEDKRTALPHLICGPWLIPRRRSSAIQKVLVGST